MNYPTLEQYNEAFQCPQLALSDPELQQGSIATTGLGLPLALCGGFALTYTVRSGSKKYAVRCFHKQSNALEKRYSSISNRLKTLRSQYFVDFEFQPQGIKFSGKTYPVVKMAWATGITLGEFLEQHYRSTNDLQQLGTSLRGLTKYLESQSMAHGDIQPGNLMVAESGKEIQLIDYDGMFVEDLKLLGSTELGHRNFQHPGRSSTSWNPSIDRFSFISLDLALRVLQAHPELWIKTQSDGDSILFKANDFANPSTSAIFLDLFNRPKFAEEAKNFAAICNSTYDKIPTLEDFLAKRNIPQAIIANAATKSATFTQYMSAFSVLDAMDYSACFKYVGDKVELIGQIVEVYQGKIKPGGKKYVFINFGPWQGKIVKISIWPKALQAISNKPTQSWVGKWISVVGLMEPPYVKEERGYTQRGYTHLSISITQGNQLHIISDQEAKFRLAGSSIRSSGINSRLNNKEILESLLARGENSSHSSATSTQSIPTTSNQAVLQKMKGNHSQNQTASKINTPYSAPRQSTQLRPARSRHCFIATAIYSFDAPETNALRKWRDRRLLSSTFGRVFVAIYYRISPKLVPYLNQYPLLKRAVKKILDLVVHVVQ
ncbi:MAG: protein kinase family protein [Ottowia sp.]|nr:protein kinase family protein [Ottowia sp.]